MAKSELRAYAKINLSLDVLGRREDGYHELRMIMQTIGLYDRVTIETKKEPGIFVESGSRWVPSGPGNTVYKAAAIIFEKFGITGGLRINVFKKIPVAAGLAGGSTDAAAVLKGLNELYKLGLTEEELMLLGGKIGADVPFCVAGGTMLAEGIGDKLTRISSFAGHNILLLKPKIGVSTAWVYKNLKVEEIKKHPDTQSVLKAIDECSLEGLKKSMGNVLEEVTIPAWPVVQQAKERLMEVGATGCMMSGSGPSVFGFFEGSSRAMEAAYEKTRDSRWQSFQTSTLLPD